MEIISYLRYMIIHLPSTLVKAINPIIPVIPDLASINDSAQEGLTVTDCDRASLKGKSQRQVS